MRAKDGEDVPFGDDPFAMAGAVENWLNDLVTFMKDTLRASLEASLQEAAMWDTDRPREEWVALYPAQARPGARRPSGRERGQISGEPWRSKKTRQAIGE